MAESKFQIETSNYRCERCETEFAHGARYYSAVVFAEQGFGRRNFCPECWNGGPGPGMAADAREGSGAGGAPSGDGAAAREDASEFYAFWRTRRPQPSGGPARPRVRLDPEAVLQFFRRLASPSGAGAEAPASQPPRPGTQGTEEPSEKGIPDAGAGETVPGTGTGGEPGRSPPTREARDLRFVLSLLLLRKKALLFEGSAQDSRGREWLRFREKDDAGQEHWVENPELSDDELETVRDRIGELLGMDV